MVPLLVSLLLSIIGGCSSLDRFPKRSENNCKITPLQLVKHDPEAIALWLQEANIYFIILQFALAHKALVGPQ